MVSSVTLSHLREIDDRSAKYVTRCKPYLFYILHFAIKLILHNGILVNNNIFNQVQTLFYVVDISIYVTNYTNSNTKEKSKLLFGIDLTSVLVTNRAAK